MHPGGGVFGAGRATAIKMFEDLRMNFEATVGADHADGNDKPNVGHPRKAEAPGTGAPTEIAPSEGMTVYGAQNEVLMNVTAIESEGNELVVKGRIFGAMPLTAKIPPEEVRAAFRILSFRRLFFLLSLLFRRSSRKRAK
jgi:hypothetical protein